MSDIVERLRSPEVLITNGLLISPVAHEGAAEIARLRAENERLRATLEEIRDLPGEINTGNYNHDDAVRLNDAFIETYHIARAALEGKP
jgi:hypothetical protein